MKTNRREFISLSLAAGIGSALPGCSRDKESMKEKYMVLDGILKKSVLKTEFFPDPVIIDNLELLAERYLSLQGKVQRWRGGNFCRQQRPDEIVVACFYKPVTAVFPR
ncbi:MAG TPA: hypothetical protein PK766_11625 [Bacteroidales bacterium]|nr:hypothetical protein [Bacteroidales bacterium]